MIDSITNKVALNDSITFVKSIFTDHLLKPTSNLELIYKTNSYLIWPVIILFISFVLMVAIRVSDIKKISDVLSAVFSLRIAKQLSREEYGLSKRNAIFFSINYILLLSMLIFECNRFFNLGLFKTNSSLIQYLFMLIIIVTTYSAKHLFISFISILSNTANLLKDYWFSVIVFSHALTILLFPITVILLFSSIQPYYLLYLVIYLFIGFYLLRLVRIFALMYSEQNIGIVYIIMYLCTLEILPFLVLIKFLFINF